MKRIFIFILVVIIISAYSYCQNVNDLIRTAYDLVNNREYKKCLEVCNKALEINPNSGEVYFILGYVKSNMKKHKECIADYDQAIKLGFNSAWVYNNRGWEYFLINNFEAAEKDFNIAIEIDSTNVNAWINTCTLKTGKRDFKGALETINLAINSVKNNIALYLKRSTLYSFTKEYDLSEKDALKVLEIDSTNLDGYHALNALKLLKKDLNGSLTLLDSALNKFPSLYNLYKLRSKTKELMNNDLGAVLDLNYYIKINQNDDEAYYLRSTYKQKLKDFNASIIDINKAISLYPQGYYFSQRARIYSELSDTLNELYDLNKAIELSHSAWEYLERGRFYQKQKNYIEALDDFNTAIKLKSYDGYLYFERGHLKLTLEDKDGACNDFRKALEYGWNDAKYDLDKNCK